MAEVKAGNPIELSEYPISNGLIGYPEFKWWVKHTLRQRDHTIVIFKDQRIRKGRIKFGVEIPSTVEE